MLKSSSSISSRASSSVSSMTASSFRLTGVKSTAVGEGECVYRIPDNSGEFRVLDLINGGPLVIQELFLSRSFGEVDGSVERGGEYLQFLPVRTECDQVRLLHDETSLIDCRHLGSSGWNHQRIFRADIGGRADVAVAVRCHQVAPSVELLPLQLQRSRGK